MNNMKWRGTPMPGDIVVTRNEYGRPDDPGKGLGLVISRSSHRPGMLLVLWSGTCIVQERWGWHVCRMSGTQ